MADRWNLRVAGAVMLLACAPVAAGEWDSLVAVDSTGPAAIHAVAIDTSSAAWWSLSWANPGARQRVLTRFEPLGTEPVAQRVLSEPGPTSVVALADGSVVLFQQVGGGGGGCVGSCEPRPPLLLLQLRDSLGDLRWSRVFEGGCDRPRPDGDLLALSCGGVIYTLDAEGITTKAVRPFRTVYRSSRHWVLNDGRELVVAEGPRTAVALVDADGELLWRRQFAAAAHESDISVSRLYLRLGANFASGEFVALDLADGTEAGRVVIDQAGPSMVWLDRLRVLQPDPAGAGRLLTLADDLAPLEVLPFASGWQPRLLTQSLDAAPDLIVAGTQADGTLELVRIDASATVSTLTLGGDRFLSALHGLPGGFAVVSAKAFGDSLRITRFGGNDAQVSVIDTLPAPAMKAGVIDPQRDEIWLGAIHPAATSESVGLSTASVTARLDRFRFADGRRESWRESLPRASSDLLLSPPVIGAEHTCVAHHPDPAMRDTGDFAAVYCAPRAAGLAARSSVLTLPGNRGLYIELGVDSSNRSVVLSDDLTGIGSNLLRSSLSADGSFDTVRGGIVSLIRPAILKPDLSGLLGQRLIDINGVDYVGIGTPMAQTRAGLWLPEGDLVVVMAETIAGVEAFRVERYSADGTLWWSTSVPTNERSAGQPSFRLAAGAGLLALEDSLQSRILLDLDTGQLLDATDSIQPRTLATPQYVELPTAQGSSQLWRLRTFGPGLLAELASPGQTQRIWLPCQGSSCQLSASSRGSDGRLLVQLREVQRNESRMLLGSARLDAGGQPATALDLGSGRWRVDGAPEQGIVVGRSPFDGQIKRFLVERRPPSGDTGQLGWSQLEPLAVTPHRLDFALQAPTRFPRVPVQAAPGITLDLHRLSLYPLAASQPVCDSCPERSEWLLSREIGSSQLTQADGIEHQLGRLTLDQHSSATRLYFATDKQWIALDQVAGRGLWGRPDGSWLVLQRADRSSWRIVDSIVSPWLDLEPPRSLEVGRGRLLESACGTISWRVSSTEAGQGARFRTDFQPTEFRTLDCG